MQAGGAAAAELPNKVHVFKSGQDGYHTFRIPAVVRAANGDLLAWAEGRKNGRSDAGDIDVVMKRSVDGGQSWGPMRLVQDEWTSPAAPVTIGNPVPIVDHSEGAGAGRVWLVFTRNNDRVFVTSSDDHGATWSPRREITASAKAPSWGWYATGPGHGIQLERGTAAGYLIVPSDHRDQAGSRWGAHVLYSSDHGDSWRIGAVDTRDEESPIHPNENVAVELVDGRLYINARDQHGSSGANRAVAYSSDGGLSYDMPFAAEAQIMSPVVQNSAVRIASVDRGNDRNILAYCCPSHPSERRNLALLLSYDEGTNWRRFAIVHTGPAAYSDLVQLDDQRVGILYEAGEPLYEEILFTAVDVHPTSRRP